MSTIRREQTNISAGGGAKYEADYVVVFGTSDTVYWSVAHMLNTMYPVVHAFDEFGDEIDIWDVVVVDSNNVKVYFGPSVGPSAAPKPPPSGKVVVF